ncbi:hypothetical protein [Cuniculiplasma divulgatum]|uniref:Uncharacterized protein n=1 Tax=Cuniculiplasma divulgatum TaxID=1673428 RepID=A0A1N5ULR0_9ARCH|nr:hypothetical protein [Cuniculiplasma divulgatum]SIM61521.1 hypothetical protein CSP5_1027 [Cuniculiplasma divulgatum]SJK84861.1 hypothetical protein CPM_1043 [Cuniculiplasma divulgatum]
MKHKYFIIANLKIFDLSKECAKDYRSILPADGVYLQRGSIDLGIAEIIFSVLTWIF